MADQPKTHRSLAEISHLFLSSVRERQTQGHSRPQRRPPKAASVDLTPEELEHVFAIHAAQPTPPLPAASPQAPPVRAIIASHLNESQPDAATRYARSLAASGERVGLIF